MHKEIKHGTACKRKKKGSKNNSGDINCIEFVKLCDASVNDGECKI